MHLKSLMLGGICGGQGHRAETLHLVYLTLGWLKIVKQRESRRAQAFAQLLGLGFLCETAA